MCLLQVGGVTCCASGVYVVECRLRWSKHWWDENRTGWFSQVHNNIKINAVAIVPVNFYIAICRRGRGLGLHKSTVFYMELPVL